jgi:hypothetical protein
MDLGLSETYRSNELANFAINHAGDYARGYVIDGSRGGRNNLYGGMFNRGVGYAVGAYYSRGSLASFDRGVYTYTDERKAFGDSEAITIGNVVTGSAEALSNPYIFNHELGHFYNQSNLGASYLPVHGISQGLGLLTRQKYGSRYNPLIFMEQRPMKDLPYSDFPK